MARVMLYAVVGAAILISAHSQREVPYPHFEFMGKGLPNNSYIDHVYLQGGKDSLMCVTTYTSCCDDPPIGNWFSDQGEPVHQGLDGATTLYVTRGDRVVQLNRITGRLSGMWRCDIPDGNGNLQSIYIYMGAYYLGRITHVRLAFAGLHTPSHVSPPVFTLNCTNRGPATTVTWTRNDVMIQEDANHRMTKTILNTSDPATYENTLTVTGREAGVYQCTVTNNRPKFNENSSNTFTVIEATPPSDVIVGGSSPTSVYLRWQAPPQAAHGNTSTGYLVLYRGEGEASWSRKEVKADETQAYIDRLSDTSRIYNMSVVSLSQHLPSDPQLTMVSYARAFFEIYFGNSPAVLSVDWSESYASNMDRSLRRWLEENTADRCNCEVPTRTILNGALYFGQGVSYRGTIGGEERFVQEISTHIETIVKQRRFIPGSDWKFNLRVDHACPVLIPSLDVEQCWGILS